MSGVMTRRDYAAAQGILPISVADARERKLLETYRGFLMEYAEELRSDPEHYLPVLDNAQAFVRSLQVKIGSRSKEEPNC